jgi:hypothetical protein
MAVRCASIARSLINSPFPTLTTRHRAPLPYYTARKTLRIHKDPSARLLAVGLTARRKRLIRLMYYRTKEAGEESV